VPLYEYHCEKCGRFEVIQKFSDAPLEVCPTCGKDVQKLLSAPAIQFKGTGWYITDYARKSSGTDGTAKTDGGTQTDSAKAGEGAASASASDSGSSAPSKTASKDSSAKGSSAGGGTPTK